MAAGQGGMPSVLRGKLAEAFRNAVIAAVLTAVVIVPIFGLPLVREGAKTLVGTPDWNIVMWGSALVFLFQLLKPLFFPLLKRGWRELPERPSLPEWSKPWLLAAILTLAIVWPFSCGNISAWPFSGGPLSCGRSAIDIATLALVYVMLGLGLNIVVGFAGLLDLGFVGFYAVGAYAYAMLNQYAGWGFWEALPVAGAMAAFFGCMLGFPVLRLRGDYLAIVTLGFGEIIRLLLINLTSWTGGPDGISGIPKPTVFGYEMARRASTEGSETFHQFLGWSFHTQDLMIYLYLIALVMALATLWVSNRLLRMPIGRAWEALREDEIACRSLGLNPTLIKLSAFTLGATFAGLGGAFFAARQGAVNPESFVFIESALILSIVVLGGMGSQLGVILAAIILTVLPEVAREFAEYRMLLFGLVMVLMMIWRPQGLLPMKRPHVELRQ